MTVEPPPVLTVLDSNLLFSRAADLAACLCSQILDPDNGVPDVCFCGIVPGEAATADYAGGDCNKKCGMAWVRIMSIYPMKAVGALDTTAGNCGASLGADLELGIMRCVNTGDGRTPPSPDELLAATQLQVADSYVMLKAVVCCDTIPNKEAILSAYSPLGPAGGLLGGTYTVSIGVQ
jgi:hypothetical protein